MMRRFCTFLLLAAAAFGQERFSASPALDEVIEKAIQDHKFPGAVLIVGHDGKIVHRKAYGSRSLVPNREPMTVDTIFDAASLTKVVATSASLMKLYDQGKFRLDDRVTEYLPEFQHGSSEITLRQLFTHFSGLRPDLDLKPTWSGYETGIEKAVSDLPANPPGKKFVYSDINFILLGDMVRRLSGESLADYAKHNIYEPLGMTETGFLPARTLIPRIAPTEFAPGTEIPLRGVVHDETSRNMGGVAGHAGVFTTADDLAKFAEMMLGMGTRNGVKIASAATVQKFISPQTPLDQPVLRGLGWDIDSPYSSNRGDLFPIGSYGHTGFTGTSIWIDPASRTFVILLANSVHPHRGILITSIRSHIATLCAEALLPQTQLAREGARGGVRNGIDVLAAANFGLLKGKRVGLITNHTGLLKDGRRDVDAMRAAGVNLVAIFSPEHGLEGKEDRENLTNSRDAATGLPVYSLYSGKNRPTPEMLAQVDTLAFDIQDIGARFYTYSCTMIYAMEEAAKAKKGFVVLDRPNPITGLHVEGPVLDSDLQSFTGCFEMPVRHGLTMGELARMVNGERRLGLDLQVVKAEGWKRGDWFDETGLAWVNTSPNMRSLTAAMLYPGLALLEYSKNYSVGRGTDAPFEQIGADWIDGTELAAELNGRRIPGIQVHATQFQPAGANFTGKKIQGVRFVITDRTSFNSVRLGVEVASALGKLYPGRIVLEPGNRLIGSRSTIALLAQKMAPARIQETWQDGIQRFLALRQKYLLY